MNRKQRVSIESSAPPDEKTFPLARDFVRPGFDEDSDTSRQLE